MKNKSLRKSYREVAEHTFDDYKNLGFEYKNYILRKTLSSLFYLDEKRAGILDKIQEMIYELIESVKIIKKFRNYAVKKNSNKIN